MRGVQNLEGVALRVTQTVPLPLGYPSTQGSMNRLAAQQELERQNFRVRGSGGDAVFRPAARWLRPPFPVTVRLTQGIMDHPHPPPRRPPRRLNPPPPPPKMTQEGNDPLAAAHRRPHDGHALPATPGRRQFQTVGDFSICRRPRFIGGGGASFAALSFFPNKVSEIAPRNTPKNVSMPPSAIFICSGPNPFNSTYRA